MFPPVSFLFSLLGLLIATYTDFKERIIPNWVSYGMLVLGLVLSAYESWSTNSIMPLVVTVAVVIATYVVAYGLWRLGAWAGGDVKLFTGLAALNPFNPMFLTTLGNFSFVWGGKELLVASGLPVFMFNLFVLSVFMLIPYTALLSLRAVKSFSDFQLLSREGGKAVVDALLYALLLVLVLDGLFLLNLPAWLIFPLLLVTAFFPFVVRAVLSGLSFVLILLHVIPGTGLVGLAAVLVLINLLRTGYGFAQKHVLTFSKKISALQEGDISGETIVARGDKIVRESPVSFKTIIKTLGERDLHGVLRMMNPSGEVLASPAQAAGFYPDQIARLQGEVKRGMLSDEIKVKASAPFAPAVLLAYIVLNVVGDGPFAWGFFG